MRKMRRTNLTTLEEEVIALTKDAQAAVEQVCRLDPKEPRTIKRKDGIKENSYEKHKHEAARKMRLAQRASAFYREARELDDGQPMQAVEDARAASDVRRRDFRDEGLPYGPGKEASFLLDQYAARQGNKEAVERIVRSNRQLRAEGYIDRAQERALNEGAGTGGDLAPPVHLQRMWIDEARAERPLVSLVNKSHPLPPNEQKVFIPKVSSGGTVAAQEDLGSLSDTDLVTENLEHEVATMGGAMEVARQLWDRAIPSLLDFVVFPTLAKDYLLKTGVGAISGSGVKQQLLGVLSTSGITKVELATWSKTDPSALAAAWSKAIKGVFDNRKRRPDAAIMTSDRWNAILEIADAQKRPLLNWHAFVPGSGPTATVEGERPESVGHLGGVPVYIDQSIPTNLGAKTNADVIVMMHCDDLLWLEDSLLKTKIDEESLSEDMALRLSLYGYQCFFPDRYASGISVIEGKGLEAPSL